MTSVSELLDRATAKRLTDKDIARITGRNPATVWRWRNRPPRAIMLDEGILRLMEAVRD